MKLVVGLVGEVSVKSVDGTSVVTGPLVGSLGISVDDSVVEDGMTGDTSVELGVSMLVSEMVSLGVSVKEAVGDSKVSVGVSVMKIVGNFEVSEGISDSEVLDGISVGE